MSEPTAAEALRELFEQKKKDGSPKWTASDVSAVRAVFLLEIARRSELDTLDGPQRVELAVLLDEIGINEGTDPKQVDKLVKAHFTKLKINAAILVKVDGILRRFRKREDRLEAASVASAEVQRLLDQDALKAPHVGEEAPEDSTQAQSLAQSLGVKVRI